MSDVQEEYVCKWGMIRRERKERKEGQNLLYIIDFPGGLIRRKLLTGFWGDEKDGQKAIASFWWLCIWQKQHCVEFECLFAQDQSFQEGEGKLVSNMFIRYSLINKLRNIYHIYI